MINIDELVRIAIGDRKITTLLRGYHYTKAAYVESILRGDRIHFYCTKLEDFSDKFEGRIIEVYYDLALEKLEKQGIIDTNVRRELSEIDPSDNRAFINEVESKRSFIVSEFDTFVLCFSKASQNLYMYENYADTPEEYGYCIEICPQSYVGMVSNGISTAGVAIEFREVLYGSQIVDHLAETVQKILENIRGEDPSILQIMVKPIIKQELNKMRFSAKFSKFSNENEFRMVLQCPVGKMVD